MIGINNYNVLQYVGLFQLESPTSHGDNSQPTEKMMKPCYVSYFNQPNDDMDENL